MPQNSLKKIKSCRAILFPHSYLPGSIVNRISAVFGDISICQPWFMDSPLPESDGLCLSFIHLLRPPENLKPKEDFKRLLSEYRTWVRNHICGAVSANQAASHEMYLSEEYAWEIRQQIRVGEKDAHTTSKNNVLKWHLILHLARELEEAHRDVKEMMSRIKQQKSPLEGTLQGETPLRGLLDDLPPSTIDTFMDNVHLHQVFEAWFGLFGKYIQDYEALVTLDQTVMNYAVEIFEDESTEELASLFSKDQITVLRLPGLLNDREQLADPLKAGLSGKTIILVMA